ncbi:MAG: hypothetical protein ACK55Z_21360, partial [bacterium]
PGVKKATLLGYIFFQCWAPYSKGELNFYKCCTVFLAFYLFCLNTHYEGGLKLAKAVPTLRYQYLSAMIKIQTYCIWIRMLAFFRIQIWTGSWPY